MQLHNAMVTNGATIRNDQYPRSPRQARRIAKSMVRFVNIRGDSRSPPFVIHQIADALDFCVLVPWSTGSSDEGTEIIGASAGVPPPNTSKLPNDNRPSPRNLAPTAHSTWLDNSTLLG